MIVSDAVLTPSENDDWLGLPKGRTKRLIRQHLIPHVSLPATGKGEPEVRLLRDVVEGWLKSGCPKPGESKGATDGS